MRHVEHEGKWYSLCQTTVSEFNKYRNSDETEIPICHGCHHSLKSGIVPFASLKSFDFGIFPSIVTWNPEAPINQTLPELTTIEKVCISAKIVHRTDVNIKTRAGQFQQTAKDLHYTGHIISFPSDGP
jgi:hypothetical protein